VLAHYGVVALPCRVGDPDRKGKVESAIGHTQAALKGLRFETLAEAQAYLDRWDARWADTRIHGTTKRQVAVMFAEERPALRPLPVEPFRYYQFGTRTVHLDGCVEVAYAYYAPPPGWLGRDVAVQWDGVHVRLLHPTTGALLREHRRQAPGRHAIHPADRPTRPPPTTLTLLAQAARAGAHVGSLCEALHRREGPAGVRRLLGVLTLVKKHGAAAVDDACAAALELQVADYRFVRRYLERHPAVPLTLRQVDPLIRDLTHYRAVIARATDDAATMLMTVTPAQLESLKRKWDVDNHRFVSEFRIDDGAQEQREARFKRGYTRITDWTGNLSSEQEARIAAIMSEWPIIHPMRYRDRMRRQREFLDLMSRRGDGRRFADRLRHWLTHWEIGRDPEYARLQEDWERRQADLYVAVARMLTPQQRAAVLRRIQGYMDDFTQLAQRPDAKTSASR